MAVKWLALAISEAKRCHGEVAWITTFPQDGVGSQVET